jgi:MazG family protein
MTDLPFERKGRVVEKLLALCARLRADDGCAWDREQTLSTLTPYLLEEVHEVIEAVATGDPASIREEIGDLLFVTIFALHAVETESLGTLEEIVEGTHEKLVRRHPHVFGDSAGDDPHHARRHWQRAKREEGPPEERSVLGDDPGKRPALLAAFRLQEKAAAVGFDWPDHGGALEKVREEADEIEAAAQDPAGGTDRVRAELGDLLFAAVNACRKLRTDPEQALHVANAVFYDRFRRIERVLAASGRHPEDLTLEELEAHWRSVKRDESVGARTQSED